MNHLYNVDCMEFMKGMEANSVDFTLTDIPYNAVNKEAFKKISLRKVGSIHKGTADVLTFNIKDFLEEVYRITNNSICIFCGKEQFSEIFGFFAEKKGMTRQIVWVKTNPSPMNGRFGYLSGTEMGVWFKKRGAKTFNAFCKNSVFYHGTKQKQIHPTEKSHKLLEELILDNTNEGDLVFDPCSGSGSTLLVASRLNRRFLGCELHEEYYDKALERLNKEIKEIKG